MSASNGSKEIKAKKKKKSLKVNLKIKGELVKCRIWSWPLEFSSTVLTLRELGTHTVHEPNDIAHSANASQRVEWLRPLYPTRVSATHAFLSFILSYVWIVPK